MATRNLTDVFILMRNNALQSRHIYSEQQLTDRVALVGRDPDLEPGQYGQSDTRLPPAWVDGLEETQFALVRLRGKMHDLETLQKKHLHRPTLDDSTEEELQIEVLTHEIGRMLAGAHRLVQHIRQLSSEGTPQEQRLSRNVVSSLVANLQELTSSFRQSQSAYLKKMKSREERSLQYFDTALDFDGTGDPGKWEADLLIDSSQQGGPQLTQQEQLLLLEDNTEMVTQREREVQTIVRSIVDLNDIFTDLAHMVVDQGTVLDRIDFNVEQCQVKVTAGLQQLQRAEQYQRKNRKMMCILCLAGTTILFLILLIIIKS